LFLGSNLNDRGQVVSSSSQVRWHALRVVMPENLSSCIFGGHFQAELASGDFFCYPGAQERVRDHPLRRVKLLISAATARNFALETPRQNGSGDCDRPSVQEKGAAAGFRDLSNLHLFTGHASSLRHSCA
jgi:hypothetical protein